MAAPYPIDSTYPPQPPQYPYYQQQQQYPTTSAALPGTYQPPQYPTNTYPAPQYVPGQAPVYLSGAYPHGSNEPIYVVQQQDAGTPIGMILFICGFCVPAAWWIGMCVPTPVTAQDYKWRQANRIATIVSIMLSIVLIIYSAMVANQARAYNAANTSHF